MKSYKQKFPYKHRQLMAWHARYSVFIAKTRDGASFLHRPCVNTERFQKGTFPFLVAMFLRKCCLEEEL